MAVHKNMYPATESALNRREAHSKKGVLLVCKTVWYYSQKDEDAFFEWLKKIPCIVDVYGIRDELYLHAKSKRIADQDLRELLALFYRYKVDMKQLEIFLNSKNKKWFYEGGRAYWSKKVFGI